MKASHLCLVQQGRERQWREVKKGLSRANPSMKVCMVYVDYSLFSSNGFVAEWHVHVCISCKL